LFNKRQLFLQIYTIHDSKRNNHPPLKRRIIKSKGFKTGQLSQLKKNQKKVKQIWFFNVLDRI